MRTAWNKRKHNEEITVKTAKGEEFKFGGISETFTRKLFEWEERKGIAPESSTIALLNSAGGAIAGQAINNVEVIPLTLLLEAGGQNNDPSLGNLFYSYIPVSNSFVSVLDP